MAILHRKALPSQGGGAARSRFDALFDPHVAGTVADVSPVAPADDPAVLAFRKLVDARRRRDVQATVRQQREMRDRYGFVISLCQVGRGGGR
jgi:hypothetical protein